MAEISVTGQAEITFVPLAGISCLNEGMPDAAEILRDRLRRLIDERTDLTARSLSLAIGANHAFVSQILSGKGGMPAASRVAQMASILGVSVDYLTGVTSSPDPVLSDVSFSDRKLDWRGPTPDLPPIPLVGTGDCATIQLEGQGGELLDIERCSFDSDHTVRMITRPPALSGARDLYAIYFHGESMMPRFEPGEVGIVDPTRPAGPGDYVLVQLTNGADDNVTHALVKRLVRSGPTALLLEQFNPPVTFKVPRNRVARVHRILPQTDLLFG
jgi:transcriptional regulator with XRE-family HTH domain